MVLIAAARLVGFGKYDHITPVLHDVLHWLPVPQRIQFKIATLTFDSFRGSSIACTVADNWGRPGLRSAKRGDLFIPRTRTTRLGRWSFFIAAPVVWNSLPLHLCSLSISHSQFHAWPKTPQLFRLAFHWLFLWELLKNWTELTGGVVGQHSSDGSRVSDPQHPASADRWEPGR